MWSIIQLRDRNETPSFGEDDFGDGLIFDGYRTKKLAQEHVREMRELQNFSIAMGCQNERYRWEIVREEEISQ